MANSYLQPDGVPASGDPRSASCAPGKIAHRGCSGSFSATFGASYSRPSEIVVTLAVPAPAIAPHRWGEYQCAPAQCTAAKVLLGRDLRDGHSLPAPATLEGADGVFVGRLVSQMLSSLARSEIEDFIEIAIEFLNAIDGDADVEDSDEDRCVAYDDCPVQQRFAFGPGDGFPGDSDDMEDDELAAGSPGEGFIYPMLYRPTGRFRVGLRFTQNERPQPASNRR